MGNWGEIIYIITITPISEDISCHDPFHTYDCMTLIRNPASSKLSLRSNASGMFPNFQPAPLPGLAHVAHATFGCHPANLNSSLKNYWYGSKQRRDHPPQFPSPHPALPNAGTELADPPLRHFQRNGRICAGDGCIHPSLHASSQLWTATIQPV